MPISKKIEGYLKKAGINLLVNAFDSANLTLSDL